MGRTQIIELVKLNRLNEAIGLLEKATQATPMYNQVILLSATYSEYIQSSRNATQDFQTLEVLRARIVNNILWYLDELSPEMLQKIASPPFPSDTISQSNPTVNQVAASSKPSPQNKHNKIALLLLIGAAGTTLFLLIRFTYTGNAPFGYQTDIHADAIKPYSEATKEITKDGYIEAQPAMPLEQLPSSVANEVNYITFDNGTSTPGVYRQLSSNLWLEENSTFATSNRYEEVSRNEISIELR
ncbi:MAG: hypothetical protein EAZ89_07105, partial [Bacteroidetes bacterium]